MKKLIALVLALVCILSLAGCGKQPQEEVHPPNLPVPEYPLNKEVIKTAMETIGLPEEWVIEEAAPHQPEGAESTLYILRNPTAELFDGVCMEIISHKYDGDSNAYGLDDCVILGIGISTIDQSEDFTREEVEKAIRLATYLVWQDESDTRIYDAFIKEFDSFVKDEESYRKTHGASSPFIEEDIDGVHYMVAYTPIDEQMKFKINFQVPLAASEK